MNIINLDYWFKLYHILLNVHIKTWYIIFLGSQTSFKRLPLNLFILQKNLHFIEGTHQYNVLFKQDSKVGSISLQSAASVVWV